MSFEAKIRALSDEYLADPRAPDIPGVVDQLFRLAAEFGAVGGMVPGGKRMEFFVPTSPATASGVSTATRRQTACFVEHNTARPTMRMICARVAAICKERAATDISPYGDKALIEYGVDDHARWSISFTNTTDQQEFLIEALKRSYRPGATDVRGDFPALTFRSPERRQHASPGQRPG